jgi:two-component system, NtrC family, nitrogen regulation response regulator NtrX
MPKLLIVDDEKRIRLAMRDILEYENYEVAEAQNGAEGLEMLQRDNYDVVLCDVRMPKLNGLELLSKANGLSRNTQFIMLSALTDQETVSKANELGAFDFLPKPPDLNRQLACIKEAMAKSQLLKSTLPELEASDFETELMGQTDAMVRLREIIEKVAPANARVLITGPNGAGKELVAKWIHQKSKRNNKPFIDVNCAAIPSELIESELFGHEKGSFTSAIKQKIGKFEQAEGGTLFLDEIGDMSLSAQAKVLRALQENKISRVGGEKDISVNVRILAATNKNLLDEIAAGRFREDLYHRLSVLLVRVPALADRREDIPALFDKFNMEFAAYYHAAPKYIKKEALSFLTQQPWSGNVRELRNVCERLFILCDQEITLTDLKAYL